MEARLEEFIWASEDGEEIVINLEESQLSEDVCRRILSGHGFTTLKTEDGYFYAERAASPATLEAQESGTERVEDGLVSEFEKYVSTFEDGEEIVINLKECRLSKHVCRRILLERGFTTLYTEDGSLYAQRGSPPSPVLALNLAVNGQDSSNDSETEQVEEDLQHLQLVSEFEEYVSTCEDGEEIAINLKECRLSKDVCRIILLEHGFTTPYTEDGYLYAQRGSPPSPAILNLAVKESNITTLYLEAEALHSRNEHSSEQGPTIKSRTEWVDHSLPSAGLETPEFISAWKEFISTCEDGEETIINLQESQVSEDVCRRILSHYGFTTLYREDVYLYAQRGLPLSPATLNLQISCEKTEKIQKSKRSFERERSMFLDTPNLKSRLQTRAAKHSLKSRSEQTSGVRASKHKWMGKLFPSIFVSIFLPASKHTSKRGTKLEHEKEWVVHESLTTYADTVRMAKGNRFVVSSNLSMVSSYKADTGGGFVVRVELECLQFRVRNFSKERLIRGYYANECKLSIVPVDESACEGIVGYTPETENIKSEVMKQRGNEFGEMKNPVILAFMFPAAALARATMKRDCQQQTKEEYQMWLPWRRELCAGPSKWTAQFMWCKEESENPRFPFPELPDRDHNAGYIPSIYNAYVDWHVPKQSVKPLLEISWTLQLTARLKFVQIENHGIFSKRKTEEVQVFVPISKVLTVRLPT